jgi:hypothetical protein
MQAVKPVPDEAQPLAPYLIVKDAPQAIAFYQRAFDARELFRLAEPSGKVGLPSSPLAAAASCSRMSTPTSARSALCRLAARPWRYIFTCTTWTAL